MSYKKLTHFLIYNWLHDYSLNHSLMLACHRMKPKKAPDCSYRTHLSPQPWQKLLTMHVKDAEQK